MARFKLPPISPLAGSTVGNYVSLLRGNRIESKYWLKTVLTFIIILIATPFHWWEKLQYGRKLKHFTFKEPPVFILGHWRSGTTHLHNILCQDPQVGFMTTYHGVWPNNLASEAIFKTFMSAAMPNKRPADNVELNVNFPQEDDFCLSNMIPYVYYNYWYFPENWRELYTKYVRFKGVNEKVKSTWINAYRKMVAKALIYNGGVRPVFKNPVNTGRIDMLLQAFPDAGFIFIHRNPIIVYLSTKRFFTELFPTLTFQKFTESEIIELIVETYEKILNDYLAQKQLIASARIIELRFEEFEEHPLVHLKEIYEKFEFKNWEEAEPFFNSYKRSKRSYKKKSGYKITKGELDCILDRWGFAMKEWGYSVPESVSVIK
ncbi:MAG: sulfotransferase [Cyclobacteriaceae bacterium]